MSAARVLPAALALVQRIGDGAEHARRVTAKHRVYRGIRPQLGHRGKLQPHAFGELEQHAKGFHRAPARMVPAEQGVLQCSHGAGQGGHIGIVVRLLPGKRLQAAINQRQRLALRAVALQRPRRDRERGEQQAAAENQSGTE
jgi:hypothetical protein